MMVKTTNFFNDLMRLFSWGYKRKDAVTGRGSKFLAWLSKHMRRE